MIRTAVVVLLGALAVLGGLVLKEWRSAAQAQLELSELRGRVQRERREEAEQVGRELVRLRDQYKEVMDVEIGKRKAAEADAGRAALAGRGLQQQLIATRARFAAATADTAGERETAAATIAVFAELLGRCSERRRELARFADDSHAAGRLCEQLADVETGTEEVGP